jgi:peroxiredoxin
MKRTAILQLTAALAVAALLAGCSGKNADDPSSGNQNRFVAGDGTHTILVPSKRHAAPNITGTALDGSHFKLSDLRGQVVVMNFWGSWCAPCRAEADDLERVYTKTQAQGVRFVGINVRDEKADAQAYEHNHGLTYPSLYDPDGRVAMDFRQLPPNSIPATVIIDRQGRVAALYRKGLVDTELQPAVSRVAAERS